MVQIVKEKYCKNDLIQLMPYSEETQLIISSDEIIFLKIGENILINKYVNHPSRYLFPYSDHEKHTFDFKTNYNQIFEYDKMYLNINDSKTGFSVNKQKIFKGDKRALYLKCLIDTKIDKAQEIEDYFTREELEKIWSTDSYDSIYLISKNGEILFANSKKDGKVIGTHIIPTNSELESKVIYRSQINETNTKDELQNMNVFDSNNGEFSHLLVTSKDGEFSIEWIKLIYIKNDLFKLVTIDIPVINLTIDDVISYTKTHDLKETPEPITEEEYDMGEVMKRLRVPQRGIRIKEIDHYQ